MPSSSVHGVVTIVAVGFFSRSSATAASSFSGRMPSVRERMMALAFSTWLLKNSPKFFMYILHLFASTTVVKPLSTSSSDCTPCTARMTSLSLPTPEGSMRMRSGWNCASTFCSASAKSPTRLQQMQPEFISLICTPESLRKPPSMAISPNSFSISTIFSPV